MGLRQNNWDAGIELQSKFIKIHSKCAVDWRKWFGQIISIGMRLVVDFAYSPLSVLVFAMSISVHCWPEPNWIVDWLKLCCIFRKLLYIQVKQFSHSNITKLKSILTVAGTTGRYHFILNRADRDKSLNRDEVFKRNVQFCREPYSIWMLLWHTFWGLKRRSKICGELRTQMQPINWLK